MNAYIVVRVNNDCFSEEESKVVCCSMDLKKILDKCEELNAQRDEEDEYHYDYIEAEMI